MDSSAGIFLAGFVVGVLVTVFITQSLRAAPSETTQPAQMVLSPILPAGPSVPNDSSETVIAGIRQELRVLTLHNEELIDRLIDAERDRAPGDSLAQLMRNARDRLQRDT